MLIKTVALYSLIYIAGITSSMAVHQVIPSAGTAARFQSGTGGGTPIFTRQIANRSVKSDRLPIKQAKRQVNDKAPLQVPVQIAPNPKFKTDCKPPIDVLGRCFADAGVNYKVG
jgi:hypothetical protein